MNKIQVSAELSILINASLKLKSDLSISTTTSELNWKSLMKLAKWHQVRPLVFDYLGENSDIKVSAKDYQVLRDYTISQAVTNMSFLRISIDLYEQLLSGKVKTFLMKGALWAWMLYEKPGSREFGDVDFFVSKNGIQDSLQILSANGFKPDPYRAYLLKKEFIAYLYLKTDYQLPLHPVGDHALKSLEIQWNSSYPRYCYSFTWDELAEGMINFHVLNKIIRVPRIENQLLMMVIHHGGIEQWDKLKYVADFVRLLRKSAHELDWIYIIKTCQAKGFYRLLMEALGLVREITGEDFFKHTPVLNNKIYPDKQLLNSIISHWENERPILKTKSWRIFLFNIRYRDGWRVRMNIVLGHLSYLTQWQLIWYKFIWYNKNPFK
jgi:hypothetical protein